MARKPKNANIDIRQTARVFDEQAFVDGVFNDDYILVVGSGVILDREQFPHSGGDINQYIIDEINSDRRAVQTNFKEHKNFTDVFKGTRQGEDDPIFSLLTSNVDDGGIEYNLGDISPELTKLLRTRLFKFIATTTIDNYLETLLRDIWGEELRVVNIEDHRSITDFNSIYDDTYSQPTLFYIFGKARKKDGFNPRHFVEIDEDAIKCIEKWMQLDEGNKSIVPFLRKKRMLALGCKFDNWYFRFFWYIITRGFGIRDRDGNPNTIDNLAIIFNPDDNSDKDLKDYLTGIDVCMHEDAWQFMERIYGMLTSTAIDSPFREMILSKRREGGMFISYKSCDVLTASSLFCKLARDNKLNVWFDNVYNACIFMRDAIANNDIDAIKRSADNFKSSNIISFNSLRCKDDIIPSLNGHVVFDDVFATRLANGEDVYNHSDEISRSAVHRGQISDGLVLAKTCMVEARKSCKYTFSSKGHQEIALIAESGGMVTLRIHVSNSKGLDAWYNDTVDVKKGQPQRMASFDLPSDCRNNVELEIINCGQKDISFVVLSN